MQLRIFSAPPPVLRPHRSPDDACPPAPPRGRPTGTPAPVTLTPQVPTAPLSAAPVEPAPPPAAAPAPSPASPVDRALLAILTGPNPYGESLATTYARKERALADAFAALTTLPIADLETLSTYLGEHHVSDQASTRNAATTSVVVAWTNLLAQSSYGSMPAWDEWEQNGSKGAKKLEGAAPHPENADERRLVTAGNIAPGSLYSVNAAEHGEQVGVLEIDVGLEGEDLRGMRLDSVGPDVRRRIATLGTVRAAPVNKLIRVFDTDAAITRQAGAVMITADGYIRSYDLGTATRVHVDPRPNTLRESLGIDQRGFREHHKANEALLRRLAEKAQDLPLSLLEGL